MSIYLITGGAGFIGSHLAYRLIANNKKIVILDDLSTGKEANIPPAARFIKGTVGDTKLLEELLKEVDFCFHLAATTSVQKSVDDWLGSHQNNLSNTVGLFDLAAKKNVPVVFASSAAIYGNIDSLPITEENPTQPNSPYGLDKLCCEQQARIFGQLKGLKSICMRFFNVYGERQDASSPYSGVISLFIEQIKNKKPINVFGTGSQQRDFIYVEDVVTRLIEAEGHVSADAACYNVCTNHAVSINEMIEILFDCFGSQVPINFLDKRPGDIDKSIGSNSKINHHFGTQNTINIEKGLELVVQHIKGK